MRRRGKRLGYLGLGATTGQDVSHAVALLPKCYSQNLHECLVNDVLDAHPNCATFLKAYDANFDAFDSAVEKLPYCSGGSSGGASQTTLYVVGGLAVVMAVAAIAGWSRG